MDNEKQEGVGWLGASREGAIGTGNWKWFPHEELPRAIDAAATWKKALDGIEKPWLCWCVDDEWNWYQQQLIVRAGWTPVVGTDGRFENPRLVDEAIFVDFNAETKYPVMWMHFPLDFVHLFCKRLAFWHSDLLPPLPIMMQIAEQFNALPDGEIAAVDMTHVGLGTKIKRLLKGRNAGAKRYFELAGCTTAGAAKNNFECGCGWWKNISHHINFQSKPLDHRLHFDNGTGIWYWSEFFDGPVQKVGPNLHPYHYSTNRRDYKRERSEKGAPVSSKFSELERSYDVTELARKIGLDVYER